MLDRFDEQRPVPQASSAGTSKHIGNLRRDGRDLPVLLPQKRDPGIRFRRRERQRRLLTGEQPRTGKRNFPRDGALTNRHSDISTAKRLIITS